MTRRGSVMMEYVILLCSIVPLAMAVSFSIVEPDGSLGPLGEEMCAFFHRVVAAIAMPWP